MPTVRTRTILTVLVVALLAVLPPATGAQQPPRSVRGIHTLAASRDAIDAQLAWASRLVGPGGTVTQPFLGIDRDTMGPSSDAVYYVEQAYTHGLDPILVLQGRYVNRDGCNDTGYVGWLKPTPDPDSSSYQGEAEGYRRFVEGLPRVDGRILTIQVGNEPNLHEMWGGAANPDEYARFFADTSAAIRAIGDPRIRVLNAALAPEGDVDNLQFIAGAVQADPRFGSSFDEWASHPYPHNRPPTSNLHDGTAPPGARYAIDAYLLELEALSASGVNTAGLRVVLTETGYELGDAHYPELPPIGEELRAAYAQQAMDEYWPRWPEVRAVTPFELAGWYGSWRSFDWVWPSSETTAHGYPTQPRPQYARLAPGIGSVVGTVRDDRGTPLQAVTVVTEPDGHRATTLTDGSFILLAPSGTYALLARKEGYETVRLGQVPVIERASSSLDLTLPARLPSSPLNPDFESAGLDGWTRWGDVDGVQAGPWFAGLAPHDGAGFLGTAVNCGAKDGGVFQRVSAAPGASLTLSAWAATYRDGPTSIGNRVGIDPEGGTDPTSERIVWSPRVETGGVWQQIAVTAHAASDRVTLFLEHDQDAANPWNVSAFDGVSVTPEP